MARGLVAVGDSLINGYTDSMAGVPGQSFALWVAQAADEPYSKYGRGGATSTDIVRDLLPLAGGEYRYGLFCMGTNDAWQGDLSALEWNVRATGEHLLERCDRVAVLSVAYSSAADRIVREVARVLRVPVVDGTVSGHRWMSADRIHPTALGQLVLADRAAAALGAPRPSRDAVEEGRGRLGLKWWAGYLVDAPRESAKRVVRVLR